MWELKVWNIHSSRCDEVWNGRIGSVFGRFLLLDPDCAEYGQVGRHNLRKFGHNRKGTPRLQCKVCGKVVAQTKGTLFYGCRHTPETIIECLALLAERNSLAALHRVKGIKEETVSAWLHKAAQQVQQIEAVLLARHRLTRVQLDALWTYVGHKGEKGGTSKSPSAAASGAAPLSTAIAGCGSDARLPRARVKSRTS